MISNRFSIACLPRWARLLLLMVLVVVLLAAGSFVLTMIQVNGTSTPVTRSTTAQVPREGIQHLMYVLPDGGPISVYDMDHAHALAETIPVPSQVTFVRGMGADPADHALYIAYGSVSSHGQL